MKINILFVIFIVVLLFVSQGVIASEIDAELITVEGRIFQDDGEPVEGFVTVVYTGSHTMLNNGRTDEDGNYSFETKKGFNVLVANASGFISKEINIDLSRQTSSRINQDFFLNPAIELSGVVFNDKGFNVPGAEVRILYYDDLQRTLIFNEEKGCVIADEQGRYKLPIVATGKLFSLYAFTANTLPALGEKLVINNDDHFDVNCMIGPERGSVKGILVDTDGNPIEGAHIMLRASADGEMYTTDELLSEVLFSKLYQHAKSNDLGEFSFFGVPFGKVLLLIRTSETAEQVNEEISHFSENSSTDVAIVLN